MEAGGEGTKWIHAGCILEIRMAGHPEVQEVGDERQQGRNKARLRPCSCPREVHSRPQKTFVKYIIAIKCQGPISYHLALELSKKMNTHAP